MNISAIKTIPQDAQATGNKPAPKYDNITPVIRAIAPDIGDCVASMIDGNVITDNVT